MNRKTVTILVLVLVLVVLPALAATFIGMYMLLERDSSSFSFGGGGKVALIRVEGVITSDRGSSGLFGGGTAGAERIVGLLERFRKDNSVKSCVIRINSPGGSAAGSQEVYQEINRVRKAGKKVIVSMGDVAASGGYYIASAADRIIADQATLTGSIGVIMTTSDMQELYDKIGIKMGAIKTGPYKDIGSSSRPMTPQERQLLQNLINDVYEQFILDVSEGRKMPPAEVRKLADGRIFTGRQAVKLKLVDRIGSLEDALKTAATDAGIKGEFEVTEYERSPGFFDILMGDTEAGYSGLLRDPRLVEHVVRGVLQEGSGLRIR